LCPFPFVHRIPPPFPSPDLANFFFDRSWSLMQASHFLFVSPMKSDIAFSLPGPCTAFLLSGFAFPFSSEPPGGRRVARFYGIGALADWFPSYDGLLQPLFLPVSPTLRGLYRTRPPIRLRRVPPLKSCATQSSLETYETLHDKSNSLCFLSVSSPQSPPESKFSGRKL